MVPKIDRLIGISIYCTKEDGSGGKIRSSPEKFFVSEILNDKSSSKILNSGNYAVYKLRKSRIDTNHALSEILQKYGLRLKALGLKDANATTEQYVCDMKPSRSSEKITTNRYTLERIGWLKKPFTKKDMHGNYFKIEIEGADFSKIKNCDVSEKILNFYGYQRFGSKRPVSHLIGKAILQKDFSCAVNTMLSFTSEYDLPENNKVREMLKNNSNYSAALKEVPHQMDVERIILKEMADHGDALKALYAIPLPLRRFFVEAFQSFVFNQTLCMAHEHGEELYHPQENDVCFDKDEILGRYENDPKQRLCVPLVGYSYSKKNRFDYYISKILQEEHITPKDFFVKEIQEVSAEGGFRSSILKFKNLEINEPFIEFILSRGSYATILLREIIKPIDPVSEGF